MDDEMKRIPAGFVFAIAKPKKRNEPNRALEHCIVHGVYGTVLGAQPDSHWADYHEGTLADYASMQVGDNVYFFSDRLIYGVGRLVNVNGQCRYDNFPGASSPRTFNPDEVRNVVLYQDEAANPARVRWVCLFEPFPAFFKQGVDMDDVLSSKPTAFRILRSMQRRSFIKLGFEENQALRDVILRANADVMSSARQGSGTFEDDHVLTRERIRERLACADYALGVDAMVGACARPPKLGHEMALELDLVARLSTHDAEVEGTFGAWDYVSHQVLASPFKPLDWADHADVFAYAFIAGHEPTVARYLAAELKKAEATGDAVRQVMKYVDWITEEYAGGDYSMIHAFIVAPSFSADALALVGTKDTTRYFTVLRRQGRTRQWRNLTLVRYECDATTRKVSYATEARGQVDDEAV